MLSILLGCATTRAQFNSFAEGFTPSQGSEGLSSSIPDLRISGIGSLNQVTDSADNAASANVLAEFNLINFKIGGNTIEKALRFNMNFNVNAELGQQPRDSVFLSQVFFPDRSRIGFGAGIGTDMWRFITTGWTDAYSQDKVHIIEQDKKFSYLRVEPALEYSYARWNLRSTDIVQAPDTLTLPDTVSVLERIQTSQWNFGFRIWYTMHSGDNTFGFMLYPHVRSQTISDATMPVFSEVFREKVNGDKVPQSLTFWGLTAALQLNKVQFSFTYSELGQQAWINDNNVSGGVFLLKVSVVSDLLQF
jgi:hypothetical protein